MNEPRGGNTITIQGMECHLPPQPKPTEIMNSHLPLKDQKWRRTELPIFRAIDIEWFSGDEPEDLYTEIDWETARREEIIKQTGCDPYDLDSNGNPREVKGVEIDPDYVSEPLDDFRMQEYDRIFNGMWFYNNGIPTYINGMYYFYLNWWKMDVGYPKYREPDKELFYLVELADNDPRCFGLLYITKRGTGKDLKINSLVWTENGAIQIKDVKVGDYIYGADGKLTKVIERFDYNDQMQYEIEFEDGRKVECGGGHLWTIVSKVNKGVGTFELNSFKNDYKNIMIPAKFSLNTEGFDEFLNIKSITPTGVSPSVCIAVDNEDKLFVTNDFIVTHNSFIAGNLAYYQTITNKKSHIGIQSKTDEDAKELFLTKIAEPYKDLPDFLIPTNRNGSNPVNGLDFSPRSTIGRKAMLSRKSQQEALRSKLDFKNAGEKAYDGTSLRFLIQDEVGKVEEKIANVYKRWLVNRECVYRDGRKRGIAFLTTTVEEMDKGGEPCKKIWYDSNIEERSGNGRTKTWLYRYFRSAIESQYFDEFGYPLREKSKLFFDMERKQLESDPKSLISYIQKNPYTIEEAFMTQGENCIYNASILQERQVYLSTPGVKEKTVRIGDFAWKDGVKDGTVIFVDNDLNGMWEISYLNIDSDKVNHKVRWAEFDGVTQWKIGTKTRRVIGYDPYSHKRTMDINKQSEAAAAIFQKYDFHIPDEYCDTIIADFAGRLNTPDEAHEQVIMAAVYFGAEILPESNKYGAIEYIERRGYSQYLMDRPSGSGARDEYRNIKGMPSNPSTISYYVEKTKNHIQAHGKKLKHLRIVRDWLEFDPNNTTKFDSGVAASFAVVASEKPIEEEVDSLDISNFLITFDHRGNEGKINK